MSVIGREPPADIVIPAPQVSARHAEIRDLGDGWFQLTDLRSTNGTFVNGQRIQSARIRLSDRVSMGSLVVDLQKYSGSMSQPSFPPAGAGWAGRPPAPSGSFAAAPAIQAIPAENERHARARAEPGLGTDLAVALAAQKSFVGKAFLVWFLYYIGFGIIGLIMNLVYLSEAKGVARLTGSSPSGMGCLQALLAVHLILIAIVVGLIVSGGLMISSLFG